MSLRDIQKQSLWELGLNGGFFGPQRVGCGKTISTLLSALIVGAKRPLLLIPASLLEKTERDRRDLAKHWRLPTFLRVVTYESLSRVSAETLLTYYRPDMLILDECHRVKNKRAGVTRRVDRYIRANPDVIVAAYSGTIIGKSIKDFAHILRWALKSRAPVPKTEDETDIWADALDEDVNFLSRVDPGPLGGDIEEARKKFRDRLLNTPGVVASLNSDIPNALNIFGHVFPVNQVTEDNFKLLRADWARPDGEKFSEAAKLWMYARELALGLHYAWNPSPPQEWLTARRNWKSFAREIISRSRTLDTEMHVAQAVDAGTIKSPELAAWRAIRDSFKINVVPIWHDDSALKWCENWLKKPGICWVEHVFFAQELARRTGLPYFKEEGMNAQGLFIEDAKGPIIASRDSNATGRNLQKTWSRNLIVSPFPDAKLLEQLIGRTHRDLQPEDEVTVDVLFGCRENIESWDKAIARAKTISQLTGHEQKILNATIDLPEGLSRLVGHRWAVTPKKDAILLENPT